MKNNLALRIENEITKQGYNKGDLGGIISKDFIERNLIPMIGFSLKKFYTTDENIKLIEKFMLDNYYLERLTLEESRNTDYNAIRKEYINLINKLI